MKTTTVLPWFLVLGLSAGLAAVYVSSVSKESELQRLRSNTEELTNLEAELTLAREQVKVQQTEIESLRGDKQELLRLRGDVVRLRTENERLSSQARTAQSQAERAQAQATQALQAGAQQLQDLQQQNVQLRSGSAPATATAQNACINQLRQLDGAKQQWALENGKTAESVPTPQELLPYFRESMPKCPGGGVYTLNAMNHAPTCTVPGHALPVAQAQ